MLPPFAACAAWAAHRKPCDICAFIVLHLRGKRPKVILEGDLPSPAAPPPGCHFHTRCRYATEECSHTPPKMCEVEPGHFCACHHPLKDAVGTVLK